MMRACWCALLLLLIAACKSPPKGPEHAPQAPAANAQTGAATDAPKPSELDRQPKLAQDTPALTDEPFGATPEDFGLDVTILVGRNMPESLRVEDRSSRYVLFPDGALHAETGPLLTQASRPGRARWLYQQQISELWQACSRMGFADLQLANGPANPDAIRVQPGERITIITMNAHGQQWTFVRKALADAATDAAAARIVRTLAALAWIPDYTPRDLAPERYDYGPDPYAVYRTPGGTGGKP